LEGKGAGICVYFCLEKEVKVFISRGDVICCRVEGSSGRARDRRGTD